MSKSHKHIDQLKQLYKDYGREVQNMTAQDFIRGQSVIDDLRLEMLEIEQTLSDIQEFDRRLVREKAKAQKHYEELLNRSSDFI